MSPSAAHILRSRSATSLPLSQTIPSTDQGNGLRRRLSSISLKMQPISSMHGAAWAFRSKSLSSAGETAVSSIKKWWLLGCSWILSKKPGFAQDLEMNDEEVTILGTQNKGSWRHVFYKLKSELKKLLTSNDKVGLPQTCRYDPHSYAQNFDAK